MSKLALRFISGKYKGGEFVLKDGQEAVIGRSSELDIVLMEDMVSRRHAVLQVKGDKILIEDRGSTNGTFVNGEKVSKAVVSKGDRILIGTSIMKVVDASEDAPGMATQDSTQSRKAGYQELGRATMHSGARSMSGTIAEVPLPDLIQLFSTSKKTGTLVLTRDMVVAKIHLDVGRIVYATLSDAPGLAPTKAMYRILSWDDGTFDLVGPEPHNFPDLINMPTEHILMEGLRQLDELRHRQSKLPPMDARLSVAIPVPKRLADLDDQRLDVYQVIMQSPTVQEVLDKMELSDNAAATIIQELLKNGYIVLGGDVF
jgi:hypothetical protein